MSITKVQALAELEILHSHMPMPWSSTEEAVKRLEDYIKNPTMEPTGWLYKFESDFQWHFSSTPISPSFNCEVRECYSKVVDK